MTDDTERARLLIVDDDLMLRSMAARTLSHAGFEVTDAASGSDALALFEARSFDLVLLDLMMPGIDGFEVCRRMRALAHGVRTPILMLTGLNDTESIDMAYRHGATDFITKPINWTLLSHRVRYALRASRAAEAVQRGAERLARAQRLAGMAHWEVAADGQMLCSDMLMHLLGAAPDADPRCSALDFLNRVAPADREAVKTARVQLAREGKPYQIEYRLLRLDGDTITVYEQAARQPDEPGRPPVAEGITQDISERVAAHERIRQLAHFDLVTGLPNRTLLAELGGQALERARRQRERGALLHLDLDRFKQVNDALGRTQGDLVLRTLADRLRNTLREGLRAGDGAEAGAAELGATLSERWLLARVGGNAFALLIGSLTGQAQAAAVAQALLAAIAAPIDLGVQPLVLTASVGIAIYPADAQDLADLSRCAEQAAYAAKAAGRARHHFFDEQLNASAASRLQRENELRRAIAQGELRLHFQPKVDAASGALVGAEALVRWQHPERGLVAPGEFITLAEESGLIAPLTDWVLEAACTQLRRWADAGLPALTLSVNLAASSLGDMGLVEQLDGLLKRFGLSADRLALEMTESMLMHDVESSLALLHALRERGYTLSLDDFGTGYSSLGYLKRFPIDELKIDRAFVVDAARGGRDGALAVAIVTLGRELGLRVVAEGVETAAQSAYLLQAGCTLQQGYLFSRPLPAEGFEALLSAGCVPCASPPRPAAP